MSGPMMTDSTVIHKFVEAGIVPKNCRKIVIDMEVGDAVKVYYSCYGDQEMIEVLVPALLEPAVRIIPAKENESEQEQS